MPRITVVTVVKNGAKYIERAILSVINQHYPNVQYIIYDACSTDGTIDILEKYRAYIDVLVVEKDKGPADALHKAYSRADGDIYCWLNADDYYLPNTLVKVGILFSEQPAAQLVYGNYYVQEGDSLQLKYKLPFDYRIALYRYLMIAQPASFWRAGAYNKVGGINSALQFCFDFDLFLRIGAQIPSEQIIYENDEFAVFQIHPDSKTGQGDMNFKKERKLIRRQMGVEKSGLDKKITKLLLTIKLILLMLVTHGFKKTINKLTVKLPIAALTEDELITCVNAKRH